MLDAGPLVISEFMAINDSTRMDQDREYSDWIEIHNPSGTAVDLDGWFLTDEAADLNKWRLPSQTLVPGAYLVVNASGKDRAVAGSELHTNFRLTGDGEYLALVRPDGLTVSHEYAPSFPPQRADVSYGMTDDVSTFLVPEEAQLKYKVPTAQDAALGTGWTLPEYNDTGWNGFAQASRVLLTEVGTEDPDYLEIQNVSGTTVDTSGWVVAVNASMSNKINQIHSLWHLPDTMTGEQVLYRSDDSDDIEHFWGEEILWRTVGTGWAMIVDDTGNVADFVVWGWPPEYLEGLDVNINGHQITAGDFWVGEQATAGGGPTTSIQRVGSSDHDTASDWALVGPHSRGSSNAGLTVPMTTDVATGIGFDAAATGLQTAVEIDVEADMYGVNASLWSRVPFEVDEPGLLDAMQLRMRYNDGFVAYLNGTPIASRNAPDVLAWNSAATAPRSVNQSLAYEEIDVSDYLGALRPGRNVLAIQGLNVSPNDANFLVLPDMLQNSKRFFVNPTPGRSNVGGAIAFVADTKFSVDRGFYTQPFQLTITTETSGAVIYYTTNGSEPTEQNGTPYAGPITVDATTTIRARAFKEDFEPTDVDTQTYIFLADVVGQSPGGGAPGPGWPSGSVNGQIINYGMDPDIVNNAQWGRMMEDALTAIPTMSVVTGLDNLFSSSSGIFVNARNDGINWERPSSLELMYPPGASGPGFPDGADEGFQVEMGLRIRGGYSRSDSNPKHAFRFFFRSEYGDDKLRYPLFGEEGVDRFDKVDLRTSQNYSWAFGGPNNNTMVREVFSRDVQGAMGQPYTRSRYYHLYLNGQYWGVFQTQERAEARFAASYMGGDSEDYDVIKQNDSREIGATDGNTSAYYRLWQATLAGYNDNDDYFRAQGMNPDGTRNPAYEPLLDVDNLIDYMVITYYTGDRDGPGSRYTTPRPNNYYAIYNREDPDGWKFFEHDSEHSLGTGEHNMVTPLLSGDSRRREFRYFNAHWLHEQLAEANEEYALRFADRLYKHFFNDGVLTYQNALAAINYRAEQIDTAIVAESARWGDRKTHPPKDYDDWAQDVNEVRTWINNRTQTVINQVKPYGWYPDTAPPAYNQHGGQVDAGFDVTLTAPAGTIYYTLDGSDPRAIGGTVVPGAQVYGSGSSTVELIDVEDRWSYEQSGTDLPDTWTDAAYNDAAWPTGKGLLYVENDALPEPKNTPLTLGETTYYFRTHFTYDGDLQDVSLKLNTVIDDGFVVYLNGQEVRRVRMDGTSGDPVSHGEFANDFVDDADWEGPFDLPTDALRQGDNVLAVEVHQASAGSSDVVLGLRLEASVPTAGGGAITLDEPTLVSARALSGGEWSPLAEAQFYVGDPPTADNLAISEVNYHPYDPITAAELALMPPDPDDLIDESQYFEFVELFNTTADRVVDLTDVQFTNGIDFTFGDGGYSLAPGAYAVVVADVDAFQARYGTEVDVAGTFTGTLDDGGERLVLADRLGQPIHDLRYDDGGDWPGRADGKGAALELIDPLATLPADYGQSTSWRSSIAFGGTPGDGPMAATGVVINEVLTHTDFPQVDAIELHNTSGAAIPVGGWYLSDKWGWEASDQNGNYKMFRVPDDTVIPAGGYVTFYEGHYDGNNVWQVDQAIEFGGTGANDFALNGAEGDDVWLMEADAAGNLTRFADHIEFPATANGETFGRWPNATGDVYPMLDNTLDGPNSAARIGPVMISEMMYHPVDEGGVLDEFVELVNVGGQTVQLFDPANPANTWRIAGLGYYFPAGAEIPTGGVALVVPIDPATFRSRYGVAANVQIFGPYDGSLDNAGESLRLMQPDQPTQDVPQILPWLLVDQIDYRPDGDWPLSADGLGDSLHRTAVDTGGTYVASWQAAVPSPGDASALVVPSAAVVGRHVFYNRSSFDGNNAGANAADDAAIAIDKSPLLAGNVATGENYTSFSLGINGVMVDIAGLPAGTVPDADDFRFRIGNNNDPSGWADAPAPLSVTLREGDGVDGSARITLTWADYAVKKTWLEVTVVGAGLGMSGDNVFYFGNAVAEAGNSAGNAQVTTTDLLLARNNPRNFLNPAAIDFSYDYNRDGRVNSTDVLLARNNQTNFLTALQLIDLSDVQGAAPANLAWLAQVDPADGAEPQERDPVADGVDVLLAAYGE